LASVNKSSLIKQLADAYPGFIRLDITRLVNIILYEIENALKRNESVEIRGKFSIKPRNQKAGFRRNPRTGEKLFIKKKRNLLFKMSKEWAKKINEKT
tara:strand:- start:920 stop:1213 length:294 start_codon:yes stop_codon:yes gene_type:complete